MGRINERRLDFRMQPGNLQQKPGFTLYWSSVGIRLTKIVMAPTWQVKMLSRVQVHCRQLQPAFYLSPQKAKPSYLGFLITFFTVRCLCALSLWLSGVQKLLLCRHTSVYRPSQFSLYHINSNHSF